MALGSELEALAFTTQHQRQEALAMSDCDSDSMPSLVSSSGPEDPDDEDTEDTEDPVFNNEIRWFVNTWNVRARVRGRARTRIGGRVTARERPRVVASEREPL